MTYSTSRLSVLTQISHKIRSSPCGYIPANFFWDITVTFLSWEWWDFWRRHNHFRRFPKKSEVFQRCPKSAEGEVIKKTLIHKIRDREEGIVIYSFYTWFSFSRWQQLTFFIQAWDRSFQPAGVRVGRYMVIANWQFCNLLAISYPTRITTWILPGPLLSWQPTWKGRFHQQVCRATWKSFLLQIFFRDENKV